jgi:hypothetical protein
MKLKKYIKRSGKSPSVWATENGLSISTIARYLTGKGRLSVGVALQIEDACGGHVSLKNLLYRYRPKIGEDWPDQPDQDQPNQDL